MEGVKYSIALLIVPLVLTGANLVEDTEISVLPPNGLRFVYPSKFVTVCILLLPDRGIIVLYENIETFHDCILI